MTQTPNKHHAAPTGLNRVEGGRGAYKHGAPPELGPVGIRGDGWEWANEAVERIAAGGRDCWRTFSLNHDREHGGDEGDSWPRMFMSDAATAFAVLALLPSDRGLTLK